ncbi:MAG: DUF31 family protein [Mycoplasmataceae bacterium]|nr:DUF31 family protein [Mycoplasmataceae bacterium]
MATEIVELHGITLPKASDKKSTKAKLISCLISVGVASTIIVTFVLIFFYVWSNSIGSYKVADDTSRATTIIPAELKKCTGRKLKDYKITMSTEFNQLQESNVIKWVYEPKADFYYIDYLTYVKQTTSFTIAIEKNPFQKDIFKIILLPENASKVYYDFLYNMTYSLSCRNVGSATVYGTGWLLSHINGYKFYLATNLHVVWENRLNTGTMYYSWKRSGPIIPGDYTNKFEMAQVMDYTSFATPSSGIDLSVVQVDFGAVSGELKTRLDSYIARGSSAIYANYGKSSENNPLYIGGYPWHDTGGYHASWEEHTMMFSSRYNQLTYNHKIPDSDSPEFCVDTTPVYLFNMEIFRPEIWVQNPLDAHKILSWMDGGASGSAIINSRFQVVAIYWGGFFDSNRKNNYFIPAASPFGSVFTGDKAKYINGQI